jgi:ribonuclease P protein component
LLKAAEFQRVFKQSRCKSSDRMLTVLALSNDLGLPRIGMAISIKNSGNAVARNRLKRLVRESFRKHQQQLGARDFVVITRSGISECTNPQISKALASHWQNIIKQCAK